MSLVFASVAILDLFVVISVVICFSLSVCVSVAVFSSLCGHFMSVLNLVYVSLAHLPLSVLNFCLSMAIFAHVVILRLFGHIASLCLSLLSF